MCQKKKDPSSTPRPKPLFSLLFHLPPQDQQLFLPYHFDQTLLPFFLTMSMVRSRHGSNNNTEAEEALWVGLHQRRKNKYYKDAGTSPNPSPERTTMIWRQPQPQTQTQPQPRTMAMNMDRKVAVVYYLSRNGLLEQPHFMEVPLPSSSPDVGLHLRDVIARLNSLRGRGLADMYSWSSKRNYKGGYVWQDLSEDDLIVPCNDGQEYVLKGSQLLRLPSDSDAIPAPASKNSSESLKPGRITRNCGMAYEARSTAEFVRKSTDVSTQTDDDQRRTFASSYAEELRKGEGASSPPPGSSSSNEGLEDGNKSGGNQGVNVNEGRRGSDIRNQVFEGERPSGRMKAASSALMQLIMCVPKSVDGVDNNNVHV